MSNVFSHLTSSIEHRATAITIRLLTTAIKFRKAGLIFLFAIFLINCYFMLFNQQSYISFLEIFSADKNISNITAVFLRIQTPTFILILILTFIITPTLISTLQNAPTNHPHQHWKHTKSPYIIACIIWLLISYLPFIIFDFQTITILTHEDGFYETAGFLWFLLSSITFFYLFFKTTKRKNVFFLLLGLLFFFATGEEISWGQRIFQYSTPTIAASNIQHEFNLHNMPIFYTGVSTHLNKEGKTVTTTKKGVMHKWFMIRKLFDYFWFAFCLFIPILYYSQKIIFRCANKIKLSIVPLWIGIFFLINLYLYGAAIHSIPNYPASDRVQEIREAAYSFLFFIISFWFIHNPGYHTHLPTQQLKHHSFSPED